MGDRNWGLWSIPGSTSGAAVSTPVQTGKRVPPKTPVKMTGTHRPPKIPAALSRRRGPPAQKMPSNYVSFKPPVVESDESSEEEISQDARDEIARMRARRAGEKGIVYVEPDQDEMDRRRERRTMSYDERHQTAPVSMNTMYDHLKKGPCKQTSYRPKVPVYETSSEEEAEPPKPEDKKEEKKDSPKVQKKIDVQPEAPAKIPRKEEINSKKVETKNQHLEKKDEQIKSPKLKKEKPKTPSPKIQKKIEIEKSPEQKVLLDAEQPSAKPVSAVVIPKMVTEANPELTKEQTKQVLPVENVVSSDVSKTPPQPAAIKSILEPVKSSSTPSSSSADETTRENLSKTSPPETKEKHLTSKPVLEKVSSKVVVSSPKEDKLSSPKSSPSAEGKTEPLQSPKPISSGKKSLSKQTDENNNSKETGPNHNHERVIVEEKELKVELPKQPEKEPEKAVFQETDLLSELPPSASQTLQDLTPPVSNPENKDLKIEAPIPVVAINKTHQPPDDSCLLSAAEKVVEIIEEKLSSPNPAEELIVQDLQNIAEKSRSPSPSTEEAIEVPRKSKKKKKELELPKEEDFSDFDEDFDFGFKDFELVYYWTWDVANETCAICRNSLMDLDDSERTLIVWGDCGHSFHNNCMVQWTKNNPRCPLCQADWAISRIGQ